jgi:hypothetical protein
MYTRLTHPQKHLRGNVDASPSLYAAAASRAEACWLDTKSKVVRLVRDGSAMGRLEAVGGAYANIIQAFQS